MCPLNGHGLRTLWSKHQSKSKSICETGDSPVHQIWFLKYETKLSQTMGHAEKHRLFLVALILQANSLEELAHHGPLLSCSRMSVQQSWCVRASMWYLSFHCANQMPNSSQHCPLNCKLARDPSHVVEILQFSKVEATLEMMMLCPQTKRNCPLPLRSNRLNGQIIELKSWEFPNGQCLHQQLRMFVPFFPQTMTTCSSFERRQGASWASLWISGLGSEFAWASVGKEGQNCDQLLCSNRGSGILHSKPKPLDGPPILGWCAM